MRPDPINWGFVNSCVLTVTAAVPLCEPWRGDEGCKGLEEAYILLHSAPASSELQSSRIHVCAGQHVFILLSL